VEHANRDLFFHTLNLRAVGAAVAQLHRQPFVACSPTPKETPMKYLPTLRRGLLVFALGLVCLPAWADDDCDAPLNRWQTRDAVLQMAAAKGWQVQRLKIDDGCYEIRGTDAQGRSFKAKIDPETLRVLKMKQDEHRRAREREHDDESATPRSRPP
jgi:hypothetical protein